jgi:hypothetical protein
MRFGLIPIKIKRRQFGGHWPASFKSALRLESVDICLANRSQSQRAFELSRWRGGCCGGGLRVVLSPV